MFRLLPLHPILVHFPLAMLPFAALFDIVGKFKRSRSLTHAAWWCLLAAAVMSPLTAASGWLWLNDMDGLSGLDMTVHKWVGTGIPILLIVLAIWRYRAYARDVFPTWLFLSAILVTFLVVTLQGHLGGTMTFGDVATAESTQPSQEYRGIVPPDSLPTTRPDEPPTTSQSTEDGWLDSIKVRGQRHE